METLAGVVVLVVVAVLGIAISAATDARHAIEKRGDRLGPANTATVELLAEYTDEETGVRGYIVTEDPSYLSPYRNAQTRLPDRYARLEFTAGRRAGAGHAAAPGADGPRRLGPHGRGAGDRGR